MAGLHDVVQGLAAREGVEAVVVVSPDGLPIDQAVGKSVDAEAVAALTATVAQGARGLGHVVECRTLATGVLEFDNRNVVFASVGGDNFLFVLTSAGTNIGHLLYDLRRHGPALRSLL
jgi:predicted regulator of Ras-like GTPase activity (Roadblock/LC7/MglB family)